MALVDVSGEQITSCKLIAAMDAFVRTVAGVGTHVASDMLATSKRRAANGAFVISSHCVTAVSLSWILCALGLFSRGAVGGDSALLLALPGDFSCVYRCRRGALESVGAGAVEMNGSEFESDERGLFKPSRIYPDVTPASRSALSFIL